MKVELSALLSLVLISVCIESSHCTLSFLIDFLLYPRFRRNNDRGCIEKVKATNSDIIPRVGARMPEGRRPDWYFQ